MMNPALLKGTLSTIILRLLSERDPLYGYEIAQLIKVRSDRKMLIREGSLYPALHKLEADGLVDSEEIFIGKRVRRYYRLTVRGRNATNLQLKELSDFLKTIEQILRPFPDSHVAAQ